MEHNPGLSVDLASEQSYSWSVADRVLLALRSLLDMLLDKNRRGRLAPGEMRDQCVVFR